MSTASRAAPGWRTLCQITLPSEPGSEHMAVETVCAALRSLPLSLERLERLKTAVADAARHALQPGPGVQSGRPILIHVRAADPALNLFHNNQDRRDSPGIDLASGLQAGPHSQPRPHGWGFFLIEHRVAELTLSSQPGSHTIELFLYLEGV